MSVLLLIFCLEAEHIQLHFQILFGPTTVTDGTQNFVGALRVALGMCGATNIREMHSAEMIIAPSIKTEGKSYQLAQD